MNYLGDEMNADKDEDDFWEGTEKLSFNFEDSKMDQLFGSSKNDTNNLWSGIFDTSISDDNLWSTDEPQQATAKPLFSVISEKTLSCILDADKIQNLQLEADLAQPDITLRKILLGHPYTLEKYQSLASKTALLDAAILSGDGNAILIIILFLTKTLKRSLVQRLLADRPDAVNVYLHYLFIRLQTNEITDILTMLGHSKTAAMKNLHIIIRNTRDPSRLLQKLQNCYTTHFAMLPNCKEATFLHSYIKLLEWQITIKQKKGDEELPLNSTVLDSLHYAYKHSSDTRSNDVMSPAVFIREHDVSPRLHQKVSLRIKAACSKWEDVDSLLLTKGMFGNTLQTCLHIEDVLRELYKHNAPNAVLKKYFKFVSDLERRLELAKKMSCHTVVIDIFVEQRDRAALDDYRTKLQPQSVEYFYAINALRVTNVKWKN